ncbi:MAG TPA: PEP-utilizing enzyme [Chloroflexota bacterium]
MNGPEPMARLERFGFPLAGGPVIAEGVAFSADPHTGRRDLVVIGEPAQVVVETRIVGLLVRHAGARVLADEQYLALARLIQRVEWALGEGQDPYEIAWAFDGQGFWIVRARPIVEIKRVTVALAADQPVLWSNANLKDAVAGVPTTATWSFVSPYLHEIFFSPIERAGYRVPRGMQTLRRFEGRAHLDLSTIQAVYFDALGSPPAEAGRAMGGAQVEIALPPPTRGQRARWRRARLRMAWLLLRQARTYSQAIERMHRAARTLDIDFAARSNAELMAFAEHIGQLQAAFGPAFQLGNVDGGAWTEPLRQTIERWRPGQGQRWASALMANSGAVVSAEHGYRLVELAAIAARGGVDPYTWQALPESSAFRLAVQRFLGEFGHRGVYEAELANARWIEDPSYVLDQVASLMADGAFGPAQRVARQTRQEAELEVRTLPLVPRLVVRWLAHRARGAAARREAGKSALIAMALPVRRLLLEFGRRMVRDGLLDDVDDVFHLARCDLESLIRGEWDGRGARALVAERKAVRDSRLGAPPPPDLIIGAGLTGSAPSPPAPLTAGEGRHTLRGLAAAAGQASGPARIIRHPDEGGRLQRGDILVAPSTDPGWTPLFLRCAGLVTEVGGYLSHGAIVARELGLPAVLNVPHVLDLVEDGEVITVDGNAGSIWVRRAAHVTPETLRRRP